MAPDSSILGKIRASILVVSADDSATRSIRTQLAGMGLNELTIARTADEATAYMTTRVFDLVIADSGPATFDPLAAINAMRALPDPSRAETPVVVLIAAVDLGFLSSVKEVRVEFAVTKPLASSVFSDRVFRALQKRLGAPAARLGEPVIRLMKSRYTLLILTSNRGTSQLIRNVLTGLGRYDVQIAEDPRDARIALTRGKADVIIADTGPATYNALPLIGELRCHRDRRIANLPVVMLAPDDHASTIPPRQLAIEFIVPKPLVVGPLCEAIDRAAARSDTLVEREEMDRPAAHQPVVADAGEDTVWVV